jgi:hypothetical protein
MGERKPRNRNRKELGVACPSARRGARRWGKPAPGQSVFEDEDNDENDYERGALTALS